MWQVLLAAAIAGSTSLIAKHFLSNENPKQEQDIAEPDTAFTSPMVSNEGYESNFEHGIFRFSSSGSSSSKKKTRILNKKSAIKGRRLKFGAESERSGGSEGAKKRFAVCLKKRRTAKNLPAKSGPSSSSSSKDSSLFGWGLGIGIMYMMSAGNTEISKLSSAMDETSKVVQELKSELHKRKSSQGAVSSLELSRKNNQLGFDRSSADSNSKDMKFPGIPMIDDVECPSSVLTDEPPLLEMDQLEAELVSELQKLPWSKRNSPGHEGLAPNICKDQVFSNGVHELEGHNTVSYQSNGVLPSELDQKLCHLLIEQQENQIEELESELHSAQSKLNEKETELQSLKDCVRRLTEFSLSTVSDDDDAEMQVEHQCTSEWDKDSNMESDSRKSVVGMKRPINSA